MYYRISEIDGKKSIFAGKKKAKSIFAKIVFSIEKSGYFHVFGKNLLAIPGNNHCWRSGTLEQITHCLLQKMLSLCDLMFSYRKTKATVLKAKVENKLGLSSEAKEGW
jgi:hypothetical protein